MRWGGGRVGIDGDWPTREESVYSLESRVESVEAPMRRVTQNRDVREGQYSRDSDSSEEMEMAAT